MILLPEPIPRPQRDGYAFSVAGATTQTNRDGVQARRRRVSTASRTTLDLSWVLTPAQFATFAAWWRNDMAEGSLVAGIQLPNGTADEVTMVRFLGPYAASDLVGRWRVTASAEVLSPYRLTPEMIADIIAGTDSIDAAAFHSAVHHSMPVGINP